MHAHMKRIIICCDGIWNEPDQEHEGCRKPSNVVKILRGIKPLSDDGVCQVVHYQIGVGTGRGADKWLGGGTGLGLSLNIIASYRFLANKFRSEHNSRNVRIKFLGVWDTVGSLGIPVGPFNRFNRRYQFHRVHLADCVDKAFHALAIDEKRKAFQPALWESETPKSHADFEQRWFAGVHSNIGGGYQQDGLANIAMHWLKSKAADCGLALDRCFLDHYEPHYDSVLRETYQGKYRLLGKFIRPINDLQFGNEKVDETAIKRLREKRMRYRPENLMAYCQKNGIVFD